MLHGKKRQACMQIADFIVEKMREKQLQDFYASIDAEVQQKFKALIQKHNVTLKDIQELCIMRMR